MIRGTRVLMSWLLATTTLLAQKSGTFTDPKDAGPDFKVQGEYVGEIPNKGKLGAQVFAAGAGKFDVYFLAGGLPGAGWDTKTRTKTSGVTQDSKTTVTGGGWTGIITDGKLTGKTPDGEPFAITFIERKSPTLGEKPPQGATILFDGVQGEYVGEIPNKGKLGAQVFAAGGGKFEVYFLAGGLPGAGWDTKTRTKTSAITQDSKSTITGSGWTGIIANGKLMGKTPEDKAFELTFITNSDNWDNGKVVEGNLLNVGTRSKKMFATGRLHIEFRTPFQPAARGQGRGNSGVYVHGREIQVLDSFALEGKNNECGGFYGSAKPAVNMCFPPLSWQTYDVEVKPGKADNTLFVTVKHNGVIVHENFEVKGSATKGATINLQNHGNPVVYRNIWFAPLGAAKDKP